MSASFVHNVPTRPTEIPLPRLIIRALLAMIGMALAVSAFGLWLVPGNGAMPELSLIKMGLSLFMLIGGMCCLVFARSR